MKKVLLAAVILLSVNTQAVESHTVEAPIKKVFVPANGYDSNDNVQLMIDGLLPNQCQQVAEAVVKFDAANNFFYVTQLARIRPINECHVGNMPRHLGLPGYFSKEISLGVLKAGEYKIAYRDNGMTLARTFRVAPAQNVGTDDEIYAPVSNFFVPEMMDEKENVQIVLTGVIGSRCLGWKDINIEQQDDIIVIKPKMRIVSTNFCSLTPWPLEKVVSLGKLKPGRYMVHVRSMNGQGLSRVFSIVSKYPDNSGH